MEAEPVDELPRGKGWLYEPKYDGFRCIAFRDGDKSICSPTYIVFTVQAGTIHDKTSHRLSSRLDQRSGQIRPRP
jgi:hypothetical protein